MKTTLGDICIQDRQMVAPGSKDAAHLPYLGLEQIESQTGRILSNQPAHDASTGIGAAFRFDSRHVLYSKLRPYLNKVALAEHEGRCTTELIPLLPADGVDRDFLAFLLRSPSAVAHASTANTGARMPRADLDHLFAWEVNLPDSDSQRRVASRLKEQMAAVEQARQRVSEQLKAVEATRSVLLAEAFASVLDGSAPLASLASVLADVRNGLYKHDDHYGSGVRILKMFNIGRLDGSWDLSRVDLVELTKNEHEASKLIVGDVLLNRVNSRELVGKCAVVDEDLEGSVYESKNMRLRLHEQTADANFVAYWLNSGPGRKQFDAKLRQIAGMATINRSDIDSIKLPIPPLKTQRRIAARLREQFENLQQLKSALTTQLEALDKLPGAYLREAFGSL